MIVNSISAWIRLLIRIRNFSVVSNVVQIDVAAIPIDFDARYDDQDTPLLQINCCKFSSMIYVGMNHASKHSYRYSIGKGIHECFWRKVMSPLRFHTLTEIIRTFLEIKILQPSIHTYYIEWGSKGSRSLLLLRGSNKIYGRLKKRRWYIRSDRTGSEDKSELWVRSLRIFTLLQATVWACLHTWNAKYGMDLAPRACV